MYKGNHRKPKGRHRGTALQRIKRIAVSTIVAGTLIIIPSSLPIPASADSALGRELTQIALASRSMEIFEASRSYERQPIELSLKAPEKPKVVKDTYGVGGVKAVEEEVPEPVVKSSATVTQITATPPPPAQVASGACNIGVVANAVAMCNYVYANFAVSSIGGWRAGGGGDHPTGHAIDIMVGSDAVTGTAVANYAIANIGTYNIKYIIWQQRTYWPATGTWQFMEDRGSITANHYDHVHVSFN